MAPDSGVYDAKGPRRHFRGCRVWRLVRETRKSGWGEAANREARSGIRKRDELPPGVPCGVPGTSPGQRCGCSGMDTGECAGPGNRGRGRETVTLGVSRAPFPTLTQREEWSPVSLGNEDTKQPDGVAFSGSPGRRPEAVWTLTTGDTNPGENGSRREGLPRKPGDQAQAPSASGAHAPHP